MTQTEAPRGNPLIAPTLRHLPTKSHHSPLSVEISAPYGLFARSDTLPNSVSHPIPSPKAALSILQHVFTYKTNRIVILAVEILSPTSLSTKKFNLHGPERKKGVDNSQVTWEILNAPHFRITFDLQCPNAPASAMAINNGIRKIKSGRHNIPFMGVSDFLVRFSLPTDKAPVPENHTISWMAHNPAAITEDPETHLFLPEFKIVNGLAIYPQHPVKSSQLTH